MQHFSLLLFRRANQWLIIALIALMTLLLPQYAPARTVIDQVGRSVTLPDSINRVVSLAPSLTEIVYALEREDLLVGATQYSDYPPAALQLPRVGSYVRLDQERIITLRPDLCLAIKDGNPKHVIDKLSGLGIPVYVIDPRDMEGILQALSGLGQALRAEEKAAVLVKDLRRRIERVRAIADRAATRPDVFFQVDASPIVSAGDNTFTNELITLAGGRNLAAGPTDYPRFNWEEMLVLQPQIVLVTSMSGGYGDEELLDQWRRWKQLPAVRDNRVHVVEVHFFDRPTPRLVRGLELMLNYLHPELLPDADSAPNPISNPNLIPKDTGEATTHGP